MQTELVSHSLLQKPFVSPSPKNIVLPVEQFLEQVEVS